MAEFVYTPRGFRVYEALQDSYGAEVSVVESSAAMCEGVDRGPWVWIYVEGGSIRDNKGSSHLDIREAVKVRDALAAFIADNADVLRKDEKQHG